MGKTITFMGRYNSGKRNIVSTFTGVERAKLTVNQGRWVSQIKATKDDITLQGLPEEHGRMSAYRQRMDAIYKSQAFVVVVRNAEPVHYEHFFELVNEAFADKPEASMGPFLVIAGYITDKEPEVNSKVAAWAKEIGASVELLNIAKLTKKDESETQKLDSIIRSFVASIDSAPKMIAKSKKNTLQPVFVQADADLDLDLDLEPQGLVQAEPRTPPVRAPLRRSAPAPSGKVAKPDYSQPAKPQPTKLARALSFLTRGGSVA